MFKDVRPIISELSEIKRNIPLKIDIGRYSPEIRVNVHGEGERCGIRKALRLIEQAPPIIRCKECVRRRTDDCPMWQEVDHWDEDYGWDIGYKDLTEDNGFCHKGAKMDGGAKDG